MHQLPNRKPVSVWNYKPWWCQPWSIFLTGVTLISGSWLFLKTWWLTILVAIPVLTWMTFFLFIYPRVVMQNGMSNGILDALPPKDE